LPLAAAACLGGSTDKAQQKVFKTAFWVPAAEVQSKKSKILKGAAKAMTANSAAKFDVTFAKPGDFSELEFCLNLPTSNNTCDTLADVCGGSCQFVITTTKITPETGPKQACCITQELKPDLVIQEVRLPSAVPTNRLWDLVVVVKNAGAVPAAGFRIAAWQSKGAAPPVKPCNATDYAGSAVSPGELLPGDATEVAFAMPGASSPPGSSWDARAFVDSDCVVPELLEDNNQALSAAFIPQTF
jgi:hypothetical protein